MKDTVYIYVGESIDSSVHAMMMQNFTLSFSRNGLKIQPLSSEDLLQGRWINNAFALLWGGGESTSFRKSLSPQGKFRKDIIQNAHQAGVHFAGFCGGGFMAWDHVTFTGEHDYKREGEGFGLYPRKSNGAVVGLTPKNFTGMSDSAAIIPLRHKASGKHFHALYCCGPHFPVEDMPENAKPLAISIHPITEQEHIMAVQIPALQGRGSVSLYGHHPEYLPDYIDFRTREVPSIAHEDERLRREAAHNHYGITLGFNLMLYDLKTAMGLSYQPQRLIVPEVTYR